MKRFLLALIFGFVLGSVVFAQAPAPVELQPIVNFDGFFEGIWDIFCDVLKKGYLYLLSIFCLFLMLRSARIIFRIKGFEKVRVEVEHDGKIEVKTEERLRLNSLDEWMLRETRQWDPHIKIHGLNEPTFMSSEDVIRSHIRYKHAVLGYGVDDSDIDKAMEGRW